ISNPYVSVIAVVLCLNFTRLPATKWQPTIPADKAQSRTIVDLSFNNTTILLWSNWRNEKWNRKHLNLSHNLISELSLNNFRNLPLWASLNLSGNTIHYITLDIHKPAHWTVKQVQYMLDLTFFIFSELGKLQSLQSLYLLSKEISQIDESNFQNCSLLKNIFLPTNKITKFQPDAFKHLKNLQVAVNLSNNATTLPSVTFIDLNILPFEVDLSNIPWIPNCNKPISNSGQPLLSLKGFHLNCAMAIHNISFKKMAVPIGDTAVLACGTKYLIYDIYVKQNSSPFLFRNTGDISAVLRQGRTEGDFTLAVSLSVIITFICAFCLGAFARPYIGSIWRQIRRNRSSASDNTYSNQGFSSETLTRENIANTQTSLQQHASFYTGNSSRNVGSCIVEVSSLNKVALDNRVFALNTDQGNQDQSKHYVQKEKMLQGSQATNSADEADINIANKEIFSAMSDYQYNNKAFQRELNNDISSCDDSKYFLNENSEKSRASSVAGRSNMESYSLHIESSDLDSSFVREITIPFSEAQIQTNGQSSESKDANNRLQSEIAQSPQEKVRQMTSHTQSLSTQQFMLRRSNCDKELNENDNMNALDDISENFILPPPYESGNPVDTFSDSSSTDEGSVFTLSDSSSVTEGGLEQHKAGDDQLANPSATEQVVSLTSGTGKFTALPQSPNITTRFQDIMEKHENKNETYSETALISGSGPGMSETYSSAIHIDSSQDDVHDTSHIDKSDDHMSLSDSKTNNPPCYEVPGTHVTSPNSPAQNILSNPVCKQNVSFNNVTLPSVKYSPKSIPDTEYIVSKDTCLQRKWILENIGGAKRHVNYHHLRDIPLTVNVGAVA
uniref:Uncharacterized protein n=1 Tax=Pelusios castaneus TaxID=367368 RepID=A0A8C8SKI1_9SAUR